VLWRGIGYFPCYHAIAKGFFMTDHAALLCGAWTLKDWRIQFSDSRPDSFPFGEDAIGMIVYDKSGWMSATLSRARRSPLSAASALNASVESKAKALDEYLAYSARWWVEGDEAVHQVICSLNPILIDTAQRRRIRWREGELILGAIESDIRGNKTITRTHEISWKRLPVNSLKSR
jgi:hypothetical protein